MTRWSVYILRRARDKSLQALKCDKNIQVHAKIHRTQKAAKSTRNIRNQPKGKETQEKKQKKSQKPLEITSRKAVLMEVGVISASANKPPSPGPTCPTKAW